jgi:predicted PurR-regulated permease PerM
VQAALNSELFRRRALRVLLALACAAVAGWIAVHIPRTLTVFVIAAFIAFGVEPIVRVLERRVARTLAIALVYALLIAFAIVLAVLVVPATIVQLQVLAVNAPALIDGVQLWLDGVQTVLHRYLGRSLPVGYGDLHSLIAARISSDFTTTLTYASDVLIDTLTAAFIGISSLVLSAFFVLRGERIADNLYEFVPLSRRPAATAFVRELSEVFGSYVSGQVAVCAITGVAIFAFTALAGFKFALLLGIVAGLAYAVPFVGMVVAHVVALVLSASQGASTTIWVQAIVFTVARISDNLLVPKVMAESVGVSPIVVMFSVFAGGEMFGLPGLLLAIPVAALCKVAWRSFRDQAKLEPASPPAVPPFEVAPGEIVVPAEIVVPDISVRIVPR